MEFRVSQRLQDLSEIAKSKTTGQRSNEKVWFFSAVLQSNCIEGISPSDRKKEMNSLIKELDIIFSDELTQAVGPRCTIEIARSV